VTHDEDHAQRRLERLLECEQRPAAESAVAEVDRAADFQHLGNFDLDADALACNVEVADGRIGEVERRGPAHAKIADVCGREIVAEANAPRKAKILSRDTVILERAEADRRQLHREAGELEVRRLRQRQHAARQAYVSMDVDAKPIQIE
jgi:hypothetical protein